MALIVVPAGAGLGDELGLPLEELGGAAGGVVVPEDPATGVEELAEPAEFEAVVEVVVVALVGAELVPPHPTIKRRVVPNRRALKTKRGTERISQFYDSGTAIPKRNRVVILSDYDARE